MENIEPYGDKTITFTKLAKYVLQVYCMPKIMRDADKPDPMTETFTGLDAMFFLEADEKLEASDNWSHSQTEETANAYLEEIADQINILLFEAGKVAGYKSMTRE